MDAIPDKELLQYLIDSGSIDLHIVLQQLELDKRQKILEKHKYSIYQCQDGYWYTKVLKEDGKRKTVKKKTKAEIEDYLIELYESNDEDTFKYRYKKWVERQSLSGRSSNTVRKYETDYDRFFKGYPIEKMNINYITEEDLLVHINTLLDTKDIPYKTLISVWGYVRGVYKKSIIDKVIPRDADPTEYVDIQMLKKKCVEKDKTAQQRTLSLEERKQLLDNLHKDCQNVNWVSNMAVELALYTGMRVGELAGLKWTDIDFDNRIITIRHQEIFDVKTKTYSIQDTKNHKIRWFPITDDIEDVLKRIKKYELEQGWINDFVFADKDGKMHKVRISDCAKNKTRFASSTKSIHALRRTLNSNLKCNGVSTTIASALLGHTERVNDTNYTYDVLSATEKINYISNATKVVGT